MSGADKDTEKAGRVIKAMRQMKKIEIQTLQQADAQESREVVSESKER